MGRDRRASAITQPVDDLTEVDIILRMQDGEGRVWYEVQWHDDVPFSHMFALTISDDDHETSRLVQTVHANVVNS